MGLAVFSLAGLFSCQLSKVHFFVVVASARLLGCQFTSWLGQFGVRSFTGLMKFTAPFSEAIWSRVLRWVVP